MNIEHLVKKILGKKEFTLSQEIPLSYIFSKSRVFLIGLMRGFYTKRGMGKCGKKLFVGKNVKIFSKKTMQLGDNVRIENNVSIDSLSSKGMIIGNRVKFGENSKIICSGSMSSLGKGLSIGNDSNFADNTFFGAAGGIEIGNDIISGQNVRFHAENHNYTALNIPIRLQGVNQKGIKIGNNIWIGAGAVFLDGSEVEDGCIVAANAVVKDKFPPNCIIAGVPAKIVRMRK